MRDRARPLRAAIAAVLVALGALSLPVAAQGQQVLVLSGEHDGFTRLAMVLPGPGGWRLDKVDGGHALRIDRPGLTLDPSRIFDLIPRDRLERVTPLPDGLFLGISCDCHLRSFEDRPGVLVIDILPGPDPAQTVQRPLPRPGGGAAGASAREPAPQGALGAAQSWLTGMAAPSAPDAAIARPAASERPVAEAAADTPGAPDADVLGAARDALIAQIGRAASQDVVQIATPPALAGRGTEQRLTDATPAPPDPPESDADTAPGGVGFAVGTAFDRHVAGSAPPPMTARGMTCIPDERLALGDWGSGLGPWTGLSEARRALVGEFDVPREEAVIGLARSYLSMGFGAEARATLAAFPGLSLPDRALLETLAALVDDTPTPAGPLAGMADCDTTAALWALLALPAVMPEETINTAAVLRSFSTLPPHLRAVLGGRLAERLVAAGLDGAARSVAAALARGQPDRGDTLDLIEARLQLPQDAAGAAARLATLATGNGPESAEALILLVEAELARDLPVRPDMIDVLAARAFELRGTQLGDRLAMAHALALASSGAFDAAFAAARTLAARAGTGAGADALDGAVLYPLLSMLTATADDAPFLRHALGTPHWQSPAAPTALRHQIARRLIDIGLPEMALKALPERPRAPAEELRLRAEALLRAGNAAAALPLLAGFGDDALRAEALATLGDAAAAAAVLRATGAAAEARTLAWRTGDAALIAEYGSELQRRLALADDPLAAGAPPGDAPGPLARSRALIDASAELRATIDTMLQAMPAP